MIFIALEDQVQIAVPYQWDCGDGCCSRTEYRYQWVEKGWIVEINSTQFNLPAGVAELKPEEAAHYVEYGVDEDGRLQKR